MVSDVILDPKLEETLEGKEGYPHLLPLFRIDRMQKGRRNLEKIQPKSRGDYPLVGIFSTRRQYRPRPTGLTLVELAGRKKNIPRVRGLDAVNGTPVIGIQPISPRQEFLKEPKVPKWYDQLWRHQKRQKDDFRHSW